MSEQAGFVVVRHQGEAGVWYYAAPPGPRWTDEAAKARVMTLKPVAEMLARTFGGTVQEVEPAS